MTFLFLLKYLLIAVLIIIGGLMFGFVLVLLTSYIEYIRAMKGRQ